MVFNLFIFLPKLFCWGKESVLTMLNNTQVVLSSVAVLLGFFLVRWLVSRNKKKAAPKPAVKRTPDIKAMAPIKITVSDTSAPEEPDRTTVQRKVVQSNSTNLMVDAEEGDVLKPRRLSVKGSPEVRAEKKGKEKKRKKKKFFFVFNRLSLLRCK
jgi:hypothetical protein